jgi:oxygen-independent coproporphyrinogen III oxidase
VISEKNGADVQWVKCPKYFYIHWPFCKNKCHYCDFISFEKHEEFKQEYHFSLCKEVERFSHQCMLDSKKSKEDFEVGTIFFGGGSPSLYPRTLMEELFKILDDNFNLKKLQEVTIEINPADVTEEKLKSWADFGINRLSVGVQVLDDEVLHNLNRKQSKQNVYNLINLAPRYFDSISIDLILGLPGVTPLIWQNTLQTIVNWPITHISVYLLTVYEYTPLFFKIQDKTIKLAKEEQLIAQYEYTVNFLEKNDFEQYEISNFAKSGFESIHNKAYWDLKPYKGFGLAAASFNGQTRFVNEKNLIKYLQRCNDPSRNVFCSKENLNRKQKILEKLMLDLRQKKGLDLQYMLYFLSSVEKTKFLDGLEALKLQSLIRIEGKRAYLTLKGMLLENEVILKLF